MKDKVLNVANFVKKHDNIFCIILLFLSIYGITLNVYIMNSDELWNFQNVYKMYNGFQIYKDINVIVTPLFFWIGKLMFQILEPNFLTFRIYNMIIMTAMYFVSYLLLKQLKVSKKMSIFVIFFSIISTKYCLILAQANYNQLAILLFLLGVLLGLKKYKYNTIIQGVMLFLIFLAKQNIAMYYAVALIASTLFTEKNFKEKIKDILIEFSIFFFLVMILFLYFYKVGILYDFFSMAVFGIKEFATSNISVNVVLLIIVLFFIFINPFLTYNFIKSKKITKKEQENLILCNCFAITLLFIMVPIVNKAHMYAGVSLAFILFISQLKILYEKMEIRFAILEKIIPFACLGLVIYAIFNSADKFLDWNAYINADWHSVKRDEPFYGGAFMPNDRISLYVMTKYINDYKDNVVILSDRAAFYMIATKSNNGIMDLPFKGNLGKDGEQGLLEKVKNLKDSVILIVKDENDMQWQESKLVREYIINNMQKIGEVDCFMVYKP